MVFRISGLAPEPFRHLFGLSAEALREHGAERRTVAAFPGYPDRIELRDVPLGDTVLLLNHVHQPADTPYRASHAIFVNEAATETALYCDEVPPVFDGRVLSLRAFGRDGLMRDAALAQPGEADRAIRALLADPHVDHIDAHNATRGCFAARIERD